MRSDAHSSNGVIITYEITKDSKKGFGINIAGGIDEPYIAGNDGFFVSRVRRDDLVDLICVGDRIISVNDILFENKKHLEAINLLNKLSGVCIFTLERKINFNIDEVSSVTDLGKIDQSDDSCSSGIFQKLSELFFFGIGACAFFGFIFVGYRNFNKKTG